MNDHTYQKHLVIYLFRHLNHCSHCRLDKLNATQEEWKIRATGTTIGCHTIVRKGTEGNSIKTYDLT